MSVQINISGTLIDLPSSSASPNWSPAIIEAFQAIADALAAFTGPFDVPPQVQPLDAYNPGINIDMQNANFPTSDVRSVELIYAVYRQTDSSNATEAGTLRAVYNANNPINQKWEVSRIGQGDALIDFNFLDTGVVQFTTQAIAGANHAGTLTFQAKSLLQNS